MLTFAWLAALVLQVPDRVERRPPACVGLALLHFDSGSAAINPSSAGLMDSFLILLGQSVVHSRVRVTGHADRVGSERANLRLSRRRAAAVRDYLVSRGVPARLIEIRAEGERNPLVEAADETPERQNRHVSVEEQVDPAEWRRREAYWARVGRPTIVC